MGSGISLLGDFEKAALLCVAGVNIIVVVQLFAKGSEKYVRQVGEHVARQFNNNGATETDDKKEPTKKELAHLSKRKFIDSRLRLDVFWAIAFIVAVASSLKLVLPESLADQIIAAWFVGQGFALQPYVQSFLSGIKTRNNSKIWNNMCDSTKGGGHVIYYEQDKSDNAYHLHEQTILSFTLKTEDERVIRVLPWTAIDSIRVERNTISPDNKQWTSTPKS